MKRLFDLTKDESTRLGSVNLEGYIVMMNVIKKNNNNENHHYSFLVCTHDQSTVRVTKFLSKVPACTFRIRLQESMGCGHGASISALREENGQYFCTSSTKLDIKELPFRPACIRLQNIDSLKSCENERLCTIEVKICGISEEISIMYEDIGFKRVQKLKKAVIVGDKTGALELTLWEMHFNQITLNDSFQIRLAKVRTFNEQISLTTISDTSFMKIEDLGDVIREVDRTICRFHIGEGRIVALNKRNDHCICQACGSCEIIVQATCLFCNMCRSRTPKENEMIDEFYNIVIVTENNDEYSLKIPKVMLISLLSKDDSISTNIPKLIDEEVNINIMTPLKVEFKYDQSTGIVHEIIPRDISPSLKIVDTSDVMLEQYRTKDETENDNE